MLKKTLRTGVLLIGALAPTLTLAAQHTQPAAAHSSSAGYNMALVLNFEHAQAAQTGSPGFWLKGGAIDAAYTFRHGLGIAANITGEHAKNISNTVSLGKIAFMAGPRYTFALPHQSRTSYFGEALFGGVHAFDSTLPGATTVQNSANAFSLQIGGGANIALKRGFGFRLFEADFVHTSLPNNAANSQNDFRIASGIFYRFSAR